MDDIYSKFRNGWLLDPEIEVMIKKISQEAFEAAFKEDLLNLVEAGEVIAKCPLCSVLLNFEELTSCKCNTCGKINEEEILYMSKTHQPSC